MTAGPAAIGSCGTCGAVLSPGSAVCSRCETRWSGPRTTTTALPTTFTHATSGDRSLAVGVDVGLLALAVLPLVLGAVGVWPPAVAVPFGLVLAAGAAVLLVRAFRRTGGTPGALLAQSRYVDALLGTPPGPAGRPGAGVVLVRLAPSARRSPSLSPHPSPNPWQGLPAAGAAPTPAPVPQTQPQPPAAAPAQAQAQTQTQTQTPHRTAVLTDGAERIEVTSTVLLGRRPLPRPHEEVGAVVELTDPTRSVSSTHALVRWDGTTLWLVDRGSTNGSWVVRADGERRRAEPGEPLAAPAGGAVQLGNRTFQVEVS